MFWLFFAATGLAVAVAVDVGGINMNTGVNTGDFLYYLFIILILPSIYIIFIIAFPSLCFEVIVMLMYADNNVMIIVVIIFLL